MQIVIKLILAALIMLTLNACSFHLRNQHVLPPAFHCIKIDSGTPYGDFESSLRRSLSHMGVIVKRCGEAPVVIHIINTFIYQDIPTIGGSNQAHVYVYYYQVTFEVLGGNHQVLIGPRTVKTSETLIINAGTALESTAQFEILQLQMQEEAAHMIINILHAFHKNISGSR